MKAILLWALSFLGVAAPMPSAAEEDPIVVEGQRRSDRIADFVQEMTAKGHGGQLARFDTPVCPAAIGMLDQQNGMAVRRMRQVTAIVGADVAREGCQPNLLLIVVRDKARAVRELVADRNDLFGGLTAAQVRALANQPGPAASWQVVERVGRDGMPMQAVRVGDVSVPMVRGTGALSKIVNQTVPRFVGAVVVLEARAVNNATTTQVADYTLMRALAHTNADRTGYPDRSILSLLSGTAPMDEAPQSLTWWDLAYLKAYYSTPNDKDAGLQRSAMRQRMADELRKNDDTPR